MVGEKYEAENVDYFFNMLSGKWSSWPDGAENRYTIILRGRFKKVRYF